jgi:hypothetical protein
LAALLGAAAVGCAPHAEGGSGNARIALALPDGTAILSFSWQVLGPAANVVAAGNTAVSDPGASISFEAGLPSASGYTVQIDATTTTGVSCAGASQPFTVTAATVTAVPVVVICGGAPSTPPGQVDITANVVVKDNCPSITSASASPTTIPVGSRLNVSASASDPDVGDTLTYAWTPPVEFADASAPATTYLCRISGPQSVTLTVTDNHKPDSCSASVTLPVNCARTSTLNCDFCEFDGQNAGNCFNVSAANGGTFLGNFGCDGFTGADQTNCQSLHFCLQSNACLAAIESASPDYEEVETGGDSPLPCLCGSVSLAECLGSTSWKGVCAAQFVQAGGSQVLQQFSGVGPEGVAVNLLSCDIDNGCLPCGDPTVDPI